MTLIQIRPGSPMQKQVILLFVLPHLVFSQVVRFQGKSTFSTSHFQQQRQTLEMLAQFDSRWKAIKKAGRWIEKTMGPKSTKCGRLSYFDVLVPCHHIDTTFEKPDHNAQTTDMVTWISFDTTQISCMTAKLSANPVYHEILPFLTKSYDSCWTILQYCRQDDKSLAAFAKTTTLFRLYERAMHALLLERFRESADLLSYFLDQTPGKAVSYLASGWANYRAGKYQISLNHFQIALNSNFTAVLPYYCRALCYIKMDSLDQAYYEIRRGIAMDSESPYLFLERAKLYQKRGVYHKAVDDYRKIRRSPCLKPSSAEIEKRLAFCREKRRTGVRVRNRIY